MLDSVYLCLFFYVAPRRLVFWSLGRFLFDRIGEEWGAPVEIYI